MILALVAAAALATPLVPSWTEPHTWKIEVYRHSPATNRYSTDWRQTEMEVYAATVVCTPTRPRTEECAFVNHEVFWGYRLSGQPDVVLHALPMAGTLEIGWTDRGRMAHYDWVGPRDAFWAAQCKALLELDTLVDASKKECKPDFTRQVGGNVDQGLAADLVGALEVELPKNGESGGKPWDVTQSPLAGRRYLATAVASTDAKWTETGTTADGTRLELSGTVSERPMSAGSVSSDYTTATALREVAVVDGSGRPVSFEAHAIASSTGILYGFAQTDSYATRLPADAASTPPGPDPGAPAPEPTRATP